MVVFELSAIVYKGVLQLQIRNADFTVENQLAFQSSKLDLELSN